MDSQAWSPFCPPFLIGKTPASMTSEFQRAEQLLIKGQASMNPFSVQFSSVLSNSMQPHGLKNSRLPCPSPTLGACSNSCPSNYLILCRSLLPLPSIFPGIRVFSNESVLCIRWPNYWSFIFSPSSEYLELISFRMDWFDLLAVQGTLKSLL